MSTEGALNRAPFSTIKENVMIIILEGIDRVGKTTLGEMIKNEIDNCDVFKAERIEEAFDSRNNNAISYGYCMGQVQLFNKYYVNNNRHIVIDRFHWTEYVYTKVQRDKNVSNKYVKAIDKEMLKQFGGYLIILMMPININLCSRMHGSDLSQHQKLFESLYEESRLNKYKCTYQSSDVALDKVKRFIKGELV